MQTAVATYPNFEPQVRDFVAQHRRSYNGRLHLAVYFAPATRKRDVCLFEVLDGFGGDAIDPDEKLFEFGYGSTPGLPLPAGTSLRMVVTNPTELRHAIDHDWKGLRELRDGDHTIVIHSDAIGKRLWNRIK